MSLAQQFNAILKKKNVLQIKNKKEKRKKAF